MYVFCLSIFYPDLIFWFAHCFSVDPAIICYLSHTKHPDDDVELLSMMMIMIHHNKSAITKVYSMDYLHNILKNVKTTSPNLGFWGFYFFAAVLYRIQIIFNFIF